MKKEKTKKKEEKCNCEEEKCSCKECECEACDCEECECEGCNCNESEIDELRKQVVNLTDRLQRAQAEVINFKRRKEEEVSMLLRYCNKDILLKMVTIADNFERAIMMDDDNLTDEVSKFLEGFKMIYASLIAALRDNEVEEIECLGKDFDATTMEAILVEHFDDKRHHEVIDVLQKGYKYKDTILRPAMVKIND